MADKLFDDMEFDTGIPDPVSSSIPTSLDGWPRVLSSSKQIRELFDSLAFFRSFEHMRFYFRGHSDSKYKLVSSIGRLNISDYSVELKIYDKLKYLCEQEGYGDCLMPSFDKELFYLGIGRHLGLICRLLDWTAGFWEALSFLLYDGDDTDGEFWVMVVSDSFDEENRSPFGIADNRIHILREDYYLPAESDQFPLPFQRRFRQHGFYTVVKDSNLSTPLNELKSDFAFYSFIIPKCVKNVLRTELQTISVEDWLYINNNAPIIKKIKELNRQIVESTNK